MNDVNPSAGPDQVDESPRKTTGGIVILFRVLAGFGVLAVLTALFLPVTRNAREAARSTQCKGNLKQIGLALYNYESDFGAFPPAFTVDANGKPLHSWRTLILPYLDRRELYESIDLTKPWDDPANAKAYETHFEGYRCPSANLPKNQTTYLAILAPNSSLRPKASLSMTEIAVPSQTLMIIEAPTIMAVHWMSPMDANEQTVTDFGPKTKLNHNGGTYTELVDGSVRFLSADMPIERRRASISILKEDKSGLDW